LASPQPLDETPHNLARIAALSALAIAIVVVAVVLLSGGGGAEYKLRLINAGQLVKGDQIQVGGRPVGSIDAISLTDDNQAEVKFTLDDGYAPLHEGTTAVVRATSLSGIANRYVSLSPGPNSAPPLPGGATLSAERTTSIVDLDQVFDMLDAKTRRGLQNVVQGSATQYGGKGAKANAAARFFNPALSTSSALIRELLADQQAFTQFVVDSSGLVSTLAQRRDDLSGLVGNANATAGAIADENVALDQALGLLPTTLRNADTTFVNLRATLDDLDVLVRTSKPVAPRLAPFFRKLRPLVRAARPTIGDLRTLIRKPGSDNDLIEILRKTPRLEQVSRPAFADTIAALQKSQPVVEFIRPYAPDLIGWIRDFGQGASTYDANGHYARIQPIFNAFSFTDNAAGGTLSPQSPSQRGVYNQTGLLTRCPGAASQPPADRSAPFLDDGALAGQCDPGEVPPGP
jgi:phospholipid/cholesterol/gamma-HCH transport system substrate-binding protein